MMMRIWSKCIPSDERKMILGIPEDEEREDRKAEGDLGILAHFHSYPFFLCTVYLQAELRRDKSRKKVLPFPFPSSAPIADRAKPESRASVWLVG